MADIKLNNPAVFFMLKRHSVTPESCGFFMDEHHMTDEEKAVFQQNFKEYVESSSKKKEKFIIDMFEGKEVHSGFFNTEGFRLLYPGETFSEFQYGNRLGGYIDKEAEKIYVWPDFGSRLEHRPSSLAVLANMGVEVLYMPDLLKMMWAEAANKAMRQDGVTAEAAFLGTVIYDGPFVDFSRQPCNWYPGDLAVIEYDRDIDEVTDALAKDILTAQESGRPSLRFPAVMEFMDTYQKVKCDALQYQLTQATSKDIFAEAERIRKGSSRRN